MKTYMTQLDIIKLYQELLDNKKIKKNGSGHTRLKELVEIHDEKNKHYYCK